MKTPHKHAEIIKAWADGAEIQFRYNANIPWTDCRNLGWWDRDCEYRIKPEPKPDVVEYRASMIGGATELMRGANLKLIFDGETGKLKSAEVL